MSTKWDEWYRNKQDKWIINNNIKIGKTKVKVTRVAENFEKGWHSVWDDNKNELVGEIGVIRSISIGKNNHGIGVYFSELKNNFSLFPFFVLEVVN